SMKGSARVAVLSTAPALEPQHQGPPSQSSLRPRRWPVIAVFGAIVLAGIAAAATLNSGSVRLSRVAPNSLAAVDVRDHRVAAVVPVGSSPGPITFGSGSLWVANVGDRTISRIDPR